jgi:hypothetical protein
LNKKKWRGQIICTCPSLLSYWNDTVM